MITQEQDLEIHALKKQGWTITAITNHVGVDRRTVRAYLNGEHQSGVRRRRGADPFD